ncbi:MAG: YHYH protein [Ilumatobacter sp.]|nr:YHYH protein [Ilumatobacter sp.]
MTQTIARRPIAGLAVPIMLIFSACGDSANDTDSADTATVTAAAETGAADTTDTVATEPTSTSIGVTSGYLVSYSLADDEFGTMVTVTVDESTRTIETNALPDHETGGFPNAGNPNVISAQDLTWEFPTEPVVTGTQTPVLTSGVAVNGVKFEPGTAETLACSSGETYRIEALQDVYDLGLDFNNAHVQPTGEYHYHGISELLVGAYDTDEDLVHIGFAADGHLMYFSKSGAYQSGYALSTEGRTGADCVASGPFGTTIALDGTTPDGAYTSDWVWSDDTGDLDACNGTTIDGEYVYIVTDTYPYVSRCLMGEVAANAGGAPPGGGQPPGGGGRAGGPPPAGAPPPGQGEG